MSIRKKLMCLVLAVAVAFTGFSTNGCYGSYPLTSKVHKWNGKLGGTFVNSVVHFLMACVIPVYSLTLTIDFLLLNTIEALTGKKMLAVGDTYEATDESGAKVLATKNADGTLSLNIVDVNGNTANFMLEQHGNEVRVLDTDGTLVAWHRVND